MNDIILNPKHQKPVPKNSWHIPRDALAAISRPDAGAVKTRRPHRRRLGAVLAYSRDNRLAFRGFYFISAALIGFTLLPDLIGAYRIRPANYVISSEANRLLAAGVAPLADKLSYNAAVKAYEYNKDYLPSVEKNSDGLVSGPRFSAKFNVEGSKSYSVEDVKNEVSLSFTPRFETAPPKKFVNRLVYPIRSLNAQKVLTMQNASVKEDIVVNEFSGDRLEFKYRLGLPAGTEARLEQDGSVGVYGVSPALLGNVSAGSQSDRELLDKARQKGLKNNLLFTIPKPFALQQKNRISPADVYYSLKNDQLTIHAANLRAARYPLTIDPSVYIETAAKLMRGNNETNTDFDVSSELIQKSQTTGARIDAWQDNLDMNQATWDHGTAAAGGYIYRVGGRSGPSKPSIVGQQRTLLGTNSTTFTMNMPSVRPAGDLYIALMCHDGSNGSGAGGSTGGNNITGPAGWTEYADLQGLAAYYKVGTDQGGGSEAASYQWSGNSEEWAGVIIRITNFDSADPVSGTAGTGFNTSAVTPVYPATTPDNDTTLVVRAAGFDQDDPSATGWVPMPR